MPKAGEHFHKTDVNYKFGKDISEPTPEQRVAKAIEILTRGLKYHEYDGHIMVKDYAREALEALGVPRDEQP
jgi:hypothetical protein